MVALGNSTKNGKVIFAKNSDRQPDEPAEIIHIHRQKHPKKSKVRTTNISIPQVEVTAEILLCKPIWIWGAEMGANEYGVVIGNEAVFTKEKYNKKGGLLGMDLLRLGLERGKTAREAFEIIIDLLELYGQGGNHGYRKKEYYHNSYLIADKSEAWILETANDYWIGERVKNFRTISNTITIRERGDIQHPELIENACKKRWCKNPEKFDFYNDYRKKMKLEQIFAYGMNRCNRSSSLLSQNNGQIDELTMMRILRDHFPEKDFWTPAKDASFKSICIHKKGVFVPVQSTISMISVLNENIQTHWITGTSAPCTSIFKPILIPGGIEEIGAKATAFYDQTNLWWHHEKLHRLVVMDYNTRLDLYKEERDKLELQFIQETKELLSKLNKKELEEKEKQKLREFASLKFNEAMNKEEEWIELIEKEPIKHKSNRIYQKSWHKLNKKNKLPILR